MEAKSKRWKFSALKIVQGSTNRLAARRHDMVELEREGGKKMLEKGEVLIKNKEFRRQ